MNKLTLCLDFDGVVHSYSSGWQGADVIPDPPVPGAIAFILDALEYFQVAIYSSRSHQKGGINAMKAWLRTQAQGVWYESPAGPGLEEVTFPTEKPSAFISLDDRALTFTGQWPRAKSLLNFKPWNKSPVGVQSIALADQRLLEQAGTDDALSQRLEAVRLQVWSNLSAQQNDALSVAVRVLREIEQWAKVRRGEA